MATTAGILAEVPLFSLMDEDERAALAERMESREFSKGETIFNHGDAGDSLMVLHRGRVQVYVESTEGVKIILGELEAGEIVGEVSLFDPGARSATAVAVEDTEMFILEHDDLWQVIQHKPHMAVDMLAIMGKRLRATDELLRTQVARNVNVEEEDRLTFGQRIADRVASFGGSWTFIITFGIVLLVWVGVNIFLTVRGMSHGLKAEDSTFDPYPFILLNLFLSMLAALQAPVIMMSQNRQAAKDRLKADLDYEINLKAELEVAQLHHKVERMHEALTAHIAKLDKEKKTNERTTTTSTTATTS
jgi:CRP/FNR family transcriptional regulator, cyclic AMP receptor protein